MTITYQTTYKQSHIAELAKLGIFSNDPYRMVIAAWISFSWLLRKSCRTYTLVASGTEFCLPVASNGSSRMLHADAPTIVLSDNRKVVCVFREEKLRIVQSITTLTGPSNEKTVSVKDSAKRCSRT